DHGLLYFLQIGLLAGEVGETGFHSFDGPEEIDGGGARLGDYVANLRELDAKFVDGFCRGMQDSEGYAHGGGYADDGGSADYHFTNGAGYFAVAGVGVGNLFVGEAALVEHDYAAVGPLDGL